MKKLPRKFYNRSTIIVAQDLLGKILVRHYRGKLIKGRIIETEAYIGKDDPACHACQGMTERNKPMFEKAGYAYIYFTYGMHHCFNIVTEKEGFPAAVLIRAVLPLTEIDFIKKQRGKNVSNKDLTNGPAKLCQAFVLDRKLNNESLLGDKLCIENDGFQVKKRSIKKSPRVGIKEGLDKNWRFYY